MLVVAIAVVGSVTVLPAVLAKLGDGIDRGRLPAPVVAPAVAPPARRGGVWGRIAHAVTGRPVAALVVTPSASSAPSRCRRSTCSVENVNRTSPTTSRSCRRSTRSRRAFPGAPDKAELVVRRGRPRSPAAKRRLEALGERARAVTDGRGDTPSRVAEDGRTALVSVPMPDGTTTPRRPS